MRYFLVRVSDETQWVLHDEENAERARFAGWEVMELVPVEDKKKPKLVVTGGGWETIPCPACNLTTGHISSCKFSYARSGKHLIIMAIDINAMSVVES